MTSQDEKFETPSAILVQDLKTKPVTLLVYRIHSCISRTLALVVKTSVYGSTFISVAFHIIFEFQPYIN